MRITDSFVGQTTGPFRYLFFVLYEDYLDLDRAFVQEFEQSIEKLARDLKGFGAVVKPFRGDIETTRAMVFDKDWTREENAEIGKTPSLLILDRDFAEFSPREHPWTLLHFAPHQFEGHAGAAAMTDVMRTLVELVSDPETEAADLNDLARGISAEAGPDVAQVFEVKPGIFGCSIDVLAAGELLRRWWQGRRATVGRD